MFQSCPACGSKNVRGSGGDLGHHDEWQDRGCLTCGLFENWLRSQVDASEKISRWSKDRSYPPLAPHRSLTDAADPTELRLLDEIYGDTTGHARSVYADWLIARGDPLGDFIAMQCARAADGRAQPSREERAAFEEHWRAWVGPPSEIVAPYTIEFERGFWSACDMIDPDELGRVDRRTGLARVFGCRSWSTVRRLGLPRYLDPVALELLGGPVRHSLETLRIASPALLGGLAHWRGPRLELRELTYTHDHFRANTDPLPVRFDGELVVRTLRVVHHQEDPGRWIELARTMPALDELELELRDRQRPADVRALVTRAATTGLRRFVVGLPPVFAHWERTAGGELLCSRVELRPQHLPLQDAEVIRLSRLLALVDTRAARVAIAIPDVPEHPEATTRIRELDQLVRGARVVRTPAPARTAISPRRR